MKRYYTRACNFYFGKHSKFLVNKKKTIPLHNIKEISFDHIEIITRKSKKRISINQIKHLSKNLKKKINSDIKQIKSNVIPLIKSIRSNNKSHKTPVIFVEQPVLHDNSIDEDVYEKNNILKMEIDKCNDLGIEEIYLIDQENCIGHDNEGTVDGIHYNDIGFSRFAKHLLKNIKKIL